MVYLLQHLAETSAERSPDKPAVILNDISYTYAELEQAANRLANSLIAQGVGRGDRVGMFLAKSIWSVVSIHAIHKAGAAYVPVDPSAPAARARYIIAAAGIRCLITEKARLARLIEPRGESPDLRTVIIVDDAPPPSLPHARVLSLRELLDHGRDSRPTTASIWNDLAYILYTSGSTGTPKGVAISHLNALNFVNWACSTFSVTDRDVLSNHAPYHFDLSILDVFVAMKAGASVSLVPEGHAYFPYPLAQWIDEQRISIWYSVPTALSALVKSGGLERFAFKNLRTILFAGEVFPVKHLRALMEAFPRVDLYNLYGPTETNVITYHRVGRLAPDRVDPVPIGKACANMEVFVLDDHGNLVTSPGVEGELYARGSNVAQGYWGDPEATRKGFIEDPLDPSRSEKAYRTGDIVKLDDQGDLLFVGRRDDMVKSRGYRIELGEIQAVLDSHPKIVEAAVVGIPDEQIGTRIKAFAVGASGMDLSTDEVRNHCAKQLPKYMIPAEIELRESLPKTSTGKIDKTALRRAE